MARMHIFTGIDIGSSQARIVVAQRESVEDELRIIGVGVAKMNGVQKGVVTDVEEAVQSLNQALDAAERMAGVPIERAYVSINGSHIVSQNSRGVIAVSRADGEITVDDVDRVINAAQAISLPANREILHVLPQNFVVDGQEHIQDPVGMTGVRLEVEAHIIEGSAPFIKNLTKVVNQAGVHVEDFVFTPLAAARAVLEKRQKELGVAVVDMGAGTTSIAVYEEKTLLHTSVLPVGSTHITNDIAIGLRTSLDVAEAIKLEHGTALPDTVRENEAVVVESEDESEESETVSRHEVADIISARLEEIFGFVDRELKEIGRSGLLPAGVVLTGGGTHLPGIVEIAKKRLRLPVRIGQSQQWGGVGDQADDPAFAVAAGLILWAIEQEQRAGRRGPSLSVPNVGHSIDKIRDWMRSFLP